VDWIGYLTRSRAIPFRAGIIKTTARFYAGPFPNALVTNIVIDTLPLEVRQGDVI
jgi:hypothetical protein